MNRLKDETSPYLRQHAENPVNWFPWSAEALDLAQREAKPILLSIGYSACHWCHVMARESFQDPATAAAMNEHYVNIKVDREERPDLDKIYQLAHHLLTQQAGGWPLTMFLDPDTRVPFFGGTYFPKTPRYQLPGFTDLLLRISDTFHHNKTELATQGTKLTEVMGRLNPVNVEPTGIEDLALLQQARDELERRYDPAQGGFSKPPKFPMPSAIDRVLRHWAYQSKAGARDREGLDMATNTLTKIARGGIYDHVGGGFCRYATDPAWMVPHFEKMLYDNGALVALYSDALGLSPDPLFTMAVRETCDWLIREMQHTEGGFFSALDADSEGEEGKFYLWRRAEVKKLLTEEEYLIIETLYGLDKPANFEGKWNLHRYDAWRSVVERLSLDPANADQVLASAKAKLLAARAERVAPAKDDKVLTSWNGIAIRGLARASMRLAEDRWLRAAQHAADFIRGKLWDGERLLATWKDGQAKYPAYLDDYANLLEGLLELLSAEWRESDLRLAIGLADAMLKHFYDADGGFFFTADDHETLIHRPQPTMDDAMPPGNGTATRALLTLGHLLGETRYLDAAHGTLAWARGVMEQHPSGHCTLLDALEATLYAPEQIIVRGPANELGPWLAIAREGYRPWRNAYGIPYEFNSLVPAYLPRLVSADTQNRVSGFVCSALQCSTPIESLEEFKHALA
ncbi:MAG: thioredoxin domain-containing protein [Gammaproteobacteria bacterium]|nr:thioredoxin domain-containing protein [Gammaproteobacteria bacterium]